MGTLKEALDRLEEAKVLLSEAIRNDLGIEPLRIEKIAVRVKTQKECDFISEYLKLKPVSAVPKEILIYTDHSSLYDDGFIAWDFVGNQPNDYHVVDFDFFCAQHGLSVPKFVMRSHDGVELYEGDDFIECVNYCMAGHWTMLNPSKVKSSTSCRTHPKMWKAFSIKEAAEAWIKEQNKPKEIVISHTGGNVTVGELNVTFNTGERCFSAQYFKKIVEAFNSLQQQSDKKS